jgi:hypothetical protein
MPLKILGTMMQWNWGLILGLAQIVLCFGAGIGYCFVKDWRHAAYFILAAAITAVVTWWF